MSLQRDQARRAAADALIREVQAQGSQRTWKRRAERAQRQLIGPRTAAKRKHKA
jgi:hypothetical protein